MTKLYASLVGPLLGVYYPLPFENGTKARIALNTSRLSKLWCSVYSADETKKLVEKHGGLILDDKFSKYLDYDSHATSSQD